MKEPKLRFKKDDGSSFSEYINATMGDYYTERNEKGHDGLPMLSVSIHSGVSDGELDEDELGKRVKRSADAGTYKKAVEGDLVFNMMRAWQGAVGCVKTTGMVSPAYIVATPDERIYPPYMDYYVQTRGLIDRFNRLSYGALDFRKRLYWDSFIKVDVRVPEIEEQIKVADCLSDIDSVIAFCERELTNLVIQRNEIIKKIFSREIRFRNVDGAVFSEWEKKRFDDLYSSFPNKNYQLQTKDYQNAGEFPIIDQGHNYCVGYTDNSSVLCREVPCIIFGDHTTVVKYVDKIFAVGADGVKTLHTKMDNCKFAYYLLSANNITQQGYNRHFSRLKEITLMAAVDVEEQRLIADFLSDFDEAIAAARRELELWKELKKGLLQQMFI